MESYNYCRKSKVYHIILYALYIYIQCNILYILFFFLSWRDNPLVGLGLNPHSRGLFFLDHTHRHTTVDRTHLDE